MAIANRFVESMDLFVTVWDRAVSRDDWEVAARRNVVDPGWPHASRLLTDTTSFNPSLLTAEDVLAVGAVFEEHRERLAGVKHAMHRVARVELARLFEVQLDPLGPTTIVFNYLEGACPWLGVDPAAAAGVIDELRREARQEA